MLVKHFLENISDRLHELQVHSLPVVLEVDPPAESCDYFSSLGAVSHHDGPAQFVILGESEFNQVFFAVDIVLYVYLVLDRESVAVSSEPAFYVVPGLVCISADDVFDGAGCDVAIVRQTSGEGRSVIEGIGSLAFAHF